MNQANSDTPARERTTHGMPLIPGDIWNLDEKPLTRDVLEARFDNPQFHGACEDRPGQSDP